ncbi:hypothetical protein EVA_20793, partial [gut metagenome]
SKLLKLLTDTPLGGWGLCADN